VNDRTLFLGRAEAEAARHEDNLREQAQREPSTFLPPRAVAQLRAAAACPPRMRQDAVEKATMAARRDNPRLFRPEA
jgi:hypothetical protein